MPEERDRLLSGWNATGHAVPGETVPDLFEAQVRRTPDAVALVHGDEVVSYAELNRRANRLAHVLIGRGIGPESVVGIALPRSVSMVVSVLGVLKAGSVPAAGPGVPGGSSGHHGVGCGTGLRDRLRGPEAWCGSVPVLSLEGSVSSALSAAAEHDPGDGERTARLQPGHPAYVIYTSGSTGRPKGVVMPGGPLVNLMAWHASVVPGRPQARVAQFSALSFDASAHELLSALFIGKTLFVLDAETRRNPDAMAAWLDENEIEELFAPNLVLEAVYDALSEQKRSLPALRDVIQPGRR